MRILLFSFFTTAIISSGLATSAFAAKFEIDKSHTSFNFVAPHLMISKVRGHFDKFEGTFEFDEKSLKVDKVNITIKTDSVNTNEPDRDKHLRSADFFDVAKFPEMKFKSTKTEYDMDKPTRILGDLTIRGVTKPVTFDVKFNGAITDPWGHRVVAFEGSTKLNRKDFGMTWNKSLDKGGVALGDEIEIQVLGEAKVPAPAKKK